MKTHPPTHHSSHSHFPLQRYDLENAAERDEGASPQLGGGSAVAVAACCCSAPVAAGQCCGTPGSMACPLHAFTASFLCSSSALAAAMIAALSKKFGKWHGISSLINLGTLVTGALGRGARGGVCEARCVWGHKGWVVVCVRCVCVRWVLGVPAGHCSQHHRHVGVSSFSVSVLYRSSLCMLCC